MSVFMSIVPMFCCRCDQGCHTVGHRIRWSLPNAARATTEVLGDYVGLVKYMVCSEHATKHSTGPSTEPINNAPKRWLG